MEKILQPVLLPDNGDRNRPSAYPCLVIKSYPNSKQANKLMYMPERTLEAMPYKAHFIYLLDASALIQEGTWIYHKHHPTGLHKNEGKADPQEIRGVGWLPVVATNDPALLKDDPKMLSVSKLFLLEYAKFEGQASVWAEYTPGYIQSNEGKPDQEYHILAQNEKGEAVLSVRLKAEYEPSKPADEHVDPIQDAAENLLGSAEMYGDLHCQGEVFSETGYTYDQALQIFRKGAEWQEKQYIEAIEEGNITNWMLTMALRRMSSEQMKSLADSLYARIPLGTDLERMKSMFDSLAVFYVTKQGDEPGYMHLYITSEKEAIVQRLETDDHPEIAGLRHYQMFEFEDGKLVSY